MACWSTVGDTENVYVNLHSTLAQPTVLASLKYLNQGFFLNDEVLKDTVIMLPGSAIKILQEVIGIKSAAPRFPWVREIFDDQTQLIIEIFFVCLVSQM